MNITIRTTFDDLIAALRTAALDRQAAIRSQIRQGNGHKQDAASTPKKDDGDADR